MNIAAMKFLELQALVKEGLNAKEPRTEADEDQMALEDMIFLKEGAVSLARYRRKWKQERSLKLSEHPENERAIIEREREDQKDFPKPEPGSYYTPRFNQDGEPKHNNSVPIARGDF
jgi:hypothetical protein